MYIVMLFRKLEVLMRSVISKRGYEIEYFFAKKVTFTCTNTTCQFIRAGDSLATVEYRFTTLSSPI